MTKAIIITLVAAVAGLAGCSSEPAMAPSHIAALHSGSMVVAVPAKPYFTIASPSAMSSGSLAEGFGIVLGGAVGGLVADAAKTGSRTAMLANKTLEPYANLIHDVPLKQDFLAAAKSTAGKVPWMGRDPAVSLYPGRSVPGSGKMRRMVRSGGAQAIVLVKCITGFSADLESVAAMAQVEVYARGARHPNLIDGGTLQASTTLHEVGPPLKSYGFEAVAAGKGSDQGALGARANVWFEQDGARYKAALAADMTLLRGKLADFLNGRRGNS